MNFRYVVIIPPWKRAWPFIWTKLNPLKPGRLCAKFGWNWPCGSGEEDFLISSMYITISSLSPFVKGLGPSFEKMWIPFTKRGFCAKFGWNWPSGSGQEDENVKNLHIDRWWDRWHAIWKAHLNFQLRWAKNLRFHAKRHCSQTLNTNAGILGCSQSNTVLFFNHINFECSLSWSF